MSTKRGTPNIQLSIGRLSERAGCHIETIRYYERIGLLVPPPRSSGGHRVYAEADLRRLRFIRRARELGFSLREVHSLLGLVEKRAHTCTEVEALTRAHLAQVRRKLEDLRRLERVLVETVSRCTGGEGPECAVVDALFGR